MSEDNYGLDLHCSMILDDYRSSLAVFEQMKEVVVETISSSLNENNLVVTALESRIKTESSLAGKLALKGHKYRELTDLTDILGVRVITFYSDEVDKIAALMQEKFEIDWDNSVDKRKQHALESFGYMSLHYICRIPESLYKDPAHPEINNFRFEVAERADGAVEISILGYKGTSYPITVETTDDSNQPAIKVTFDLSDLKLHKLQTPWVLKFPNFFE